MRFSFSRPNTDTKCLSSLYQFKKYLLTPTIENKHCIIDQKVHEDEWNITTQNTHYKLKQATSDPSKVLHMTNDISEI